MPLLLDILEECSLSDLVDRIEVTLKEKKLTFNRVEHELGFGNGTIKRWKEQSPRLDKLMKVAEYLNVSLDYIAFGVLQTDSSPNGANIPSLKRLKEEQGLICDGSPLTDEEADVVAMYRLLPPMHRHEVYDYVFFKYQRHVEGERGFFSSAYTEEGAAIQSGPGEGRNAHTETA